MRPDSKILDDIARVAGGAINVATGLQQQVREEIHVRMEEMASRLDLVPREDLDAALSMIANLRQRLDTLESRVAQLEGKKPAATGSKSSAKKAAAPSTGTTTKAKSKTKKQP